MKYAFKRSAYKRREVLLLIVFFLCGNALPLRQSDCRCLLGERKHFAPWQVSLECLDGHQCSANCALRLNRTCYFRADLTNLNDKLLSGMKNLYDDLSETYIHPSYNPWYGSDGVKDVGLIKLKDRIRFERDEVEPACLNLLSLRDFSGEHFQVTAWDSKMETSSYSNMLHMEEFQAVSDHRRKTRGNYISATSLHSLGENGFFGEPGAPLMRNQSGKFIVEGLASHIDDRFTHDSSTGLSLMFTQFIRLESSRAFIQHFVGREYCRGSTVYSCIKKDGIFPDPENRSKFYICDNNVPISQTCPSGTEFDPSHVCCITIGDSDESDRD